MKNLKLTLITIFSFFALAAMITFSSCEQDPCTDLKCQNGGSCSEGYCQCPVGYEGAECEHTASSKFVGVYVGHTKCDAFPVETDTVTIELIEAPNKVRLKIGAGSTSLLGFEGTAETPETHFVTHVDENVEVHAYATVDGGSLYIYLETINKLVDQRQICRFTGRKISQ